MAGQLVHTIHFTMYYTIQGIMPCYKVLISLLCGSHALNFEQLKLSENLKSGLPACLADGRLASFGPNEN